MKWKLPLIFFLLAGGIMLHHYLTTGRWFDPEDVSHELLAIAFVVLGFVGVFFL